MKKDKSNPEKYHGNRRCKKVEEAESFKELKSIFENLPVGVVYLDNEFRIVSSNKSFNELAGFREEELKGKLCYEIVGEYSDDPTKRGLEKICSFCKKDECFKYKRPTVMERPLQDKFIRVTTVPELSEKGEIRRFIEIVEDITERRKAGELLKKAKDELELKVKERTEELSSTVKLLQYEITERKQAEKALMDSRNELRSMYDAITDMMTVISPDYRILSANRVVEKQFGKDLVGRVCYEVYQQRNEICPDCPAKKAIETKKPALSFQPGTEVSPSVEIYAFPILNDEGEVIAVVEHGKDITKRKKAENALRESEEKFRALFESAKDGIFILSSNGNLVALNTSFARMHGWTVEEMLKMNLKDLDTPESAALAPARFKRMLAGELLTFEVGHYCKNGQTIPLEVSANAITINGEKYILGFHRDITKRKKIEEQIRSSLEEKEVLMQEIHHRVKNNMMVISSLLRLQSFKVTYKQYKEIFDDSINRIKTMALIHEKLYHSGDLAQIVFGDYLEDMVDDMYISYGLNARNVALIKDIDKITLGLDASIPCGLIVNELLSNSLKHAFPDGRSGEVRLAFHGNDKDEVALTIGDNGVGMPAGLDFRNTDSLGLNLVTTLVRQLQGKIELYREQGTEFRITFRRRE